MNDRFNRILEQLCLEEYSCQEDYPAHFMTETLFRHMLHDAAADAGVSLRQIEARRQSPDHPILWNVPETDYLKFYIFQVV